MIRFKKISDLCRTFIIFKDVSSFRAITMMPRNLFITEMPQTFGNLTFTNVDILKEFLLNNRSVSQLFIYSFDEALIPLADTI